MYSFVLQDWITITGATTTPIVQSEQGWLEMGPYQDIVAWLDVRAQSGGSVPTLLLETAPAMDDVLFVPMTGSTNMDVTAYPTPPKVIQILMGTATVPIARFLRWKVTGSPSNNKWDVTFRLLVAANAPGLQLADADVGPLLLRQEL